MKEYFIDIDIAGRQINWSKLNNKTIFIAGATGMIGTCIVDFIMHINEKSEFNINVVAIGRNIDRANKRFNKYKNKENFKFLQHDIVKPFDFNVFNNVDYIIDTASGATPNVFKNNPVEVMESNILGMKNLLELAQNKKSRLVYISTAEIYGNVNKMEKAENDYGYIDNLKIRSAYPISKKAAETLAIAYCGEYGVHSIICRLSHVYGPTMTENDNRAASEFIRSGINNEAIILKNNKPIERSYTYVVDAVSAIFYVMLNGKCGEAYNIASNEIIKLRQFADIVSFITHVPVVIENITNNEKMGYTEIDRQVLNIDKIIQLGWRPYFKITDGIKNTILSLRTNELRI